MSIRKESSFAFWLVGFVPKRSLVFLLAAITLKSMLYIKLLLRHICHNYTILKKKNISTIVYV